MKYLRWLWRAMAGIRWDTLWRIIIGIAQVALGLLMVWLSRRFIDQTIRTGTDREVVAMIVLLVAVVLGGVVLRQLYYYLSTLACTRQTNAIRLQAFSRLFARQLYAAHLDHPLYLPLVGYGHDACFNRDIDTSPAKRFYESSSSSVVSTDNCLR